MPKPKGALTKDQLGREAEKQLRENARNLLKKYFLAVDKKLEQGDNRMIEMVGRMFQYDKGPGGVTIFNQHLQVNAQPAEQSARVRSFDQIINKLEDTDRVRALLAQPEESDADIQDAEVEDIAEPAVKDA